MGSIKDRCSINANIEEDVFVGIECLDNDVKVHFPIGYKLSDDDKEIRRDIMLLIQCLSKNTTHKYSELDVQDSDINISKFPMQSYIYVIHDFYERGYYKERETQYHLAKKGKISWSKTIKRVKPYFQDDEAFYLDFVTKKNTINDNELITLVHEYCVFESFDKIGWLFTDAMPKKPRMKFNKKYFQSIIYEKLNHTFNDRNIKLFKNMLAIIEQRGSDDEDKEYQYGTYKFHYVWENMINQVFGVDNREYFYPKTSWKLGTRTYEVEDYENSSLRPDTIMFYGDDIYVLDAKYYRFAAYKNPGALPKSTDINKQITYGEYIAEQKKFRDKYGEAYKVYNAFIMPFDSQADNWEEADDIVYSIGSATGNWKDNLKEYENIQGIMLDVKYLMNLTVREDMVEIERMAKCILEKFN